MNDPFYELSQDFITRAEQIDAPFEAFVQGLQTMLDEVACRLEMARAEQIERDGD